MSLTSEWRLFLNTAEHLGVDTAMQLFDETEQEDPAPDLRFRCRFCPRQYVSSDGVRKHCRKKHPGLLTASRQPLLYCTRISR